MQRNGFKYPGRGYRDFTLYGLSESIGYSYINTHKPAGTNVYGGAGVKKTLSSASARGSYAKTRRDPGAKKRESSPRGCPVSRSCGPHERVPMRAMCHEINWMPVKSEGVNFRVYVSLSPSFIRFNNASAGWNKPPTIWLFLFGWRLITILSGRF